MTWQALDFMRGEYKAEANVSRVVYASTPLILLDRVER